MDFNYTLKYRTFDQMMEDVTIDLHTYALENMIEPQTLIKIARKINYELGLRVNQTREAILDVCHGVAKLPDNFYTFNFALICGDYVEYAGYPQGGTNIQEVPYQEVPSTVDICAAPTVNCRSCNANPCKQTAACDLNHPVVDIVPPYDPNNPYGNTCVPPRVFTNCKGEQYEIIQIAANMTYRVYRRLLPLRMKPNQTIVCDCPNLYWNAENEGYIEDGFLKTNFREGKVYINYQGTMEDEQGNLLVADHESLNDYYEYAMKKRIFENLQLNGENVLQNLQIVKAELREARNQALSIVNTPNFKEMEKLWWTNRRAQYSKYYDMFKSYSPNNLYYRYLGLNRVI